MVVTGGFQVALRITISQVSSIEEVGAGWNRIAS